VSATEIINELPKLTEAERRAVLNKLLEMTDHLAEDAVQYRAIDLRQRGVSEAQATDLRARLKTFVEDWDRPEAAIYDENPSR